MSVIVKGMRMPEKCGLCDLFHAEFPMHCTVVKGHKTVGAPYGMPRPEWCPLVELPEKHGRLIDADELLDKMRCSNWRVSFNHDGTFLDISEFADIIRNIETVIEAEGEG